MFLVLEFKGLPLRMVRMKLNHLYLLKAFQLCAAQFSKPLVPWLFKLITIK